MSIHNRNLLLPLLLMLVITFSSGCLIKNISFKNVEDWLPNNFDPNKTVLIEPQIMGESETKKMTTFLKAHYPYPFEIATRESIRSDTGRFADKVKYPFGILWGSTRSYKDYWRDASIGGKWCMYGYFVNRSDTTIYPSTPQNNNYRLHAYIALFNSITNKFKKSKSKIQ